MIDFKAWTNPTYVLNQNDVFLWRYAILIATVVCKYKNDFNAWVLNMAIKIYVTVHNQNKLHILLSQIFVKKLQYSKCSGLACIAYSAWRFFAAV